MLDMSSKKNLYQFILSKPTTSPSNLYEILAVYKLFRSSLENVLINISFLWECKILHLTISIHDIFEE